MESETGKGGWWTRRSHQFGVTALAVALLLVGAGWFSGFARVLSWVTGGIFVAALWPVLVIVGGLAFMLLLVMVVAIGSEGGGDPEAISKGGGAVMAVGWGLGRPYYRWLARVRHPVFWGVALGAGIAVVVLLFVVGVVIKPGEQRTHVALRDAQDRLVAYFVEQRSLPGAVEGHLGLHTLDQAAPADALLRDGWGRPLRYESEAVGDSVRYRLRSLGFDGKAGADDLCATGVLHERVVEAPSAGATAMKTAGKLLRWWRKRQARKRGEAPPPEPAAEAAPAVGDRVPEQLSRSTPGHC